VIEGTATLNWCGYGTDEGCGYICSEGTAYCHHCGREPVEKVPVVAVAEAAAWLRHIDRLDEIPGASLGMPDLNPLWDAAAAIEHAFAPASHRADHPTTGEQS
jgi:hypothetical protein